MNKKNLFVFFIILVSFFLAAGCQRRTAALQEATPPAIEVAETVAIDEHTIPEEPETQPTFENSAREHSPVREVTPYELRNVMPNSWRKLTGLTEAERQAFLLENSAVISRIEALLFDFQMGIGFGFDVEHYFIFRQQVGTDIFYRILVTASSNPDFLSCDIEFIQFLINQNTVLLYAPYNNITSTQHGPVGHFGSIDIIHGRDNAKGILVTGLYTERSGSNPNEIVSVRNERLFGGNRSRFHIMADALKKAAGERVLPIRIYASDALVDPDVPLRYSLQNAFDGNPSTAFIANTEDGLMHIRIALSGLSCKLAIINGYAANYDLYYANNRVRTIALEGFGERNEIIQGDQFNLNDSTLAFQVLDFVSNGFIWITDLFKGNRYNNAVISGLNIKRDGVWLFGDIDGK